ncbi:MAG: ATP-binding cassette domain-containing protein [candidate division Zixibacteria bacterium]|nr:ATP-binding cassette domain-containing protein [candidate division Zixibacteria bacterium]
MIQIRQLGFSFKKGKPVFSRLDLNIKQGEFLILTGESGSGKTTLLRLLQNELYPQSGEINISGSSLSDLKSKERIATKRNIGAIYQDFRLVSSMTVYENVALTLKVRGQKNNAIKTQILKNLAEMGLSHAVHFYPAELSGGEKQKAAIARAVIGKPRLLLADEPTGSLDMKAGNEIIETLKKINLGGTTILLATHNYERFLDSAYRVLALSNGKLQTVEGDDS